VGKPMIKRPVKRHSVTQPIDTLYRYIPLTHNQNAIVDVGDFEWLSQFNWRAVWNSHTCSFYAARNVNTKNVYMHRVILGSAPKEETDHWNHNTLDNRRENLRKCTGTQNLSNRGMQRNNKSGFKGVYWEKDRGKWGAMIQAKGKVICLGRFQTPEEAARAYDAAAREQFGEFAFLNFPLSVTS